MLSYFLDDAHGHIGTASPPQFATTGVNVNMQPHHPVGPTNGGLHVPRYGSGSHSSSYGDYPGPPPTPAIQYYAHHSASSKSHSERQNQNPNMPPPNPHHATTSATRNSASSMDQSHQHHTTSYSLQRHSERASSSNSLTSMAASLVSGGLVLHQMQRSHNMSQDSLEAMSPISPAAMITGEHEPLYLPGTDRSPNGGLPLQQQQQHHLHHHHHHPSYHPVHSDHGDSSKQSHLEWLKHINAMAKASHHGSHSITGGGSIHNHNASTNIIPSPQSVSQHSVASHPNDGTTSSHTTTTSTSTTATSVATENQPPSIHPAGAAAAAMIPGYPHHHVVNPLFYVQAHMQLQKQQQQIPQGESEEKRARRLERNRESARKSRRRKKERLSLLEEKVAGLHSEIEVERRKQINAMDKILLTYQEERISQFRKDFLGTADADIELQSQLATLVEMTGPNCPVRKAVVDFQYSTLKQTLMPRYQKFLLWLTLHPESYFLAGKEEHAKREAGKQAPRVTSGKVSSKQIGDEMTNGRKNEDGKYEPRDGGDKPNQTADAFDAPRIWPLLCFELTISVDQEERFLQTHKR